METLICVHFNCFQVGWARAECNPGVQLGNDDSSWAFDGYAVSNF